MDNGIISVSDQVVSMATVTIGAVLYSSWAYIQMGILLNKQLIPMLTVTLCAFTLTKLITLPCS